MVYEPDYQPETAIEVKAILIDAVNDMFVDLNDLAPKVKREYEENKFSITFTNGRKFTVQVIEEHDG